LNAGAPRAGVSRSATHGQVPLLAAGRRTLVSDVDGTLLAAGEPGEGAAELAGRLLAADAALVLATGRDLELALEAAATLEAAGLPRPSALVCGVGAEVHVWDGAFYAPDLGWRDELAGSGFTASGVRAALAAVPGLQLQPERAQSERKVSYIVGATDAVDAAAAALAERGIDARLVHSAGRFLDVLPPPASKGGALLHLVARFGLRPQDVVAAGDSGNDRELLLTAADAGMLAVLVANHEPEMADLVGRPGVFVSTRPYCAGVADGLANAGW